MIPNLFRVWTLGRVLGGPGHTCSLSIQGLRTMFCPSDQQPLRPLPEKSLLMPVVLLGHGRICRAALALPLGQLLALLPGVFEVTCNPPCSQPGTFLAPCSFHVLHLPPSPPPPPLQLGLVLLCTAPSTLKPSLILLLSPVTRPTLPGYCLEDTEIRAAVSARFREEPACPGHQENELSLCPHPGLFPSVMLTSGTHLTGTCDPLIYCLRDSSRESNADF